VTRARDLANVADDVSTGTVVTTASPSLGRRRLNMNGSMIVAQRGTSTSVGTGSEGYSPDRWRLGTAATTAADIKQSTTVPSGSGFANSLHVDVTTADSTLASGDAVLLQFKFEGQDLQGIKKGTSGAESLTLSFWVRSSKTGTHVVELYDADNTRHINKACTVNTADTWEFKTIEFSGDTSGVLDNDNGESLVLNFWLGAGSTYSSGSLSDSWASVTNANRAAGQVNVFDSTSNNFYITGVQLEVGSVATPFEHRSYGEELALCQRYFEYVNYEIGAVAGSSSGRGTRFPYRMAVDKRSSPTVTINSTSTNRCSVPTAVTTYQSSVTLRTTNSNTDNDDYTASGSFTADAEL